MSSSSPHNAPWPEHSRPDPHTSHHHYPPPHPSPYPQHSPYYHHPHPPPPHHGTSPPPPPPHSQHPHYYHYPGYPPYPHPYPHPHGHPASQPHPYPTQSPQGNNSGPPSESVSTTTSKSNVSKPTETTTKTKAAKTKASTTESTKPSTVKTPKTFRFEGSISSESFKTTKSFDLAGVNILNRKPLDTKTALDKLQRRRETHNRVERKRRDCINQLIDDLTKLLPPKHLEEVTSKCHRVNVLRGAVSHIKFLNESNEALANSIRQVNGGEDVVQSILGSDNQARKNSDQEMSMDVDDNENIKEEEDDEEDMDKDSQYGESADNVSRSSTPASTSTSTKTSSPRKLLPPPVIITDAPSPSTERDASQKQGENSNNFSLESRPRSNSFASSVGDQPSPRSALASPPSFPISPISPLALGRNSLFPPGEEPTEGDKDQRRQLSPFMSPSPIASPSLPPISSLAIQSPSGELNGATNEGGSIPDHDTNPGQSFSGRTHRAGTSLPPLMIPEPHHLHPSYHGNRGESGSKRSSVTLSPNPADQPLISPFMLSPMLPRSPSIGPTTASSPGNSPYPQWGHDGMTSPYGFFNHPPYPNGYQYPPHQSPQQHPQQPQQQQSRQAPPSPSKGATKSKSLQPDSIFIQEEPWNTTRKRSTSNASKSGKSSAQDQKKLDNNVDMNGPTSPTSSITSTTSYPSSPNPKKRTQLASYGNGDRDDDDMSKRSKQEEYETNNGANPRDSGVGVVVVVEGPEGARSSCDEDAIQALASLAQTVA
ncbi:hypothetical protein BGZ76_007482 [Entomortierella beljakovae]|nr:hypothetical protein BGZ76_007482 [Entomortierella beljakovae]